MEKNVYPEESSGLCPISYIKEAAPPYLALLMIPNAMGHRVEDLLGVSFACMNRLLLAESALRLNPVG